MEENENDKIRNLGLIEYETVNKQISASLASASLTMITVVGAFTVYIVDKRDVGFLFYLLVGASFLSFISSIYMGSKGMLYGYKSAKILQVKSPNPFYNWQAITTLFGLVFFSISIFLGREKVSHIEEVLFKQQKINLELKMSNELTIEKIRAIEKALSKDNN